MQWGVDRDFGKGIALHPGQLNSENAVQAGREHLTASAPASAAWGDDRPSVRTTVLRRLATRTIDLRAELLASERDPRQGTINGVDCGAGSRKWFFCAIPKGMADTTFQA